MSKFILSTVINGAMKHDMIYLLYSLISIALEKTNLVLSASLITHLRSSDCFNKLDHVLNSVKTAGHTDKLILYRLGAKMGLKTHDRT